MNSFTPYHNAPIVSPDIIGIRSRVYKKPQSDANRKVVDTGFTSIKKAITILKKGGMIIVVDDPKRENQADLVCPAETISAEKISFMLNYCRGMICVAITGQKAVQLDLPLVVSPNENSEKTGVQFTVSVDAAKVSSFGVSAEDKTKTIQVIENSDSKPEDLVRPGHVFPLLARFGGILEREGHTEATIELARLAGFTPCGVLCEILQDDGKVANQLYLQKLSDRFSLPIISISDLAAYIKTRPLTKSKSKSLIKKAKAKLPNIYGNFEISVYKSIIDGKEHVSLTLGNPKGNKAVLTRIHSQCLTGDTLLSLKCDCRQQLHQSMKMIKERGVGVILYLNQEGRGIGLSNKIKAYKMQEYGLDTVEANRALHLPVDGRDYQAACEILKDIGLSKIALLTNNPSKIDQLTKYGITVVDNIPVEVKPNKINRLYLKTKKYKLGHILETI